MIIFKSDSKRIIELININLITSKYNQEIKIGRSKYFISATYVYIKMQIN